MSVRSGMKKRVANVHLVTRGDMPTNILQPVLSLPRTSSQLFHYYVLEWLVGGGNVHISSKQVVINKSLVSITSSYYRAFPQHACMTMGGGSSYLTIGRGYVVPCLLRRRTSVEEENTSRSTTPDSGKRSANDSQRLDMKPNVMVLQRRCYLEFSRAAGVAGVQ